MIKAFEFLNEDQLGLYLAEFDEYMKRFGTPLQMEEFFRLERRFFDSWQIQRRCLEEGIVVIA